MTLSEQEPLLWSLAALAALVLGLAVAKVLSGFRNNSGSTRMSLAEMLPRIYDLKSRVTDPAHPDAYFQEFEESLKENHSKLAHFEKLERQLAALDETSWDDLRERAAAHLVSKQRDRGRGWQHLFDVLNEAKASAYLKSIGCIGVRFVKRTTVKTPDLEAVKDGRRVLCEVKTFNKSDLEAARQQRVSRGEFLVTSIPSQLDEAFLTGKLSNTLIRAVEQLDAKDPQREAERIVFVVINFDDWVGDYQPQYLAQIDDHLIKNRIAGASLVFSVTDLFGRNLAMRTATVVKD